MESKLMKYMLNITCYNTELRILEQKHLWEVKA